MSIVADAGADASSTQDGASDAGETCNSLANAATQITLMQVAADPPTGSGGVIADGTYVMTDAVIYTGLQGATGATGTAKITIQIAGSNVQMVSGGEPTTRTIDLKTSTTSFVATDTCPDTNVLQGTFTATSTTFVAILPAGSDDAGARTLVETFLKQ